MQREIVKPSKADDAERPVPTAWRPTFVAIVNAFLAGDFELKEKVSNVAPIPPDTAKQIADYIADYGETLVALPAASWESSIAQWQGRFWDVLVDLWTEGEGGSDMVLKARVTETDDSYRFEVQLVYVP